MNQSIFLSIFMIWITFLLSCSGQDGSQDSNIDNAEPSTKKVWAPEFRPVEKDPYFVENTWIERKAGPDVITRNILEDHNGDIWLATWNGILKYDGEVFTNYTNKDKLRRYRAFCVLEDSQNDLWFGTIGAGAYKYNGKEFTNIRLENGMSDDNIECIAEDLEGNIWFGHDLGVSVYFQDKASTTKAYFKNFDVSHGIAGNDVHDITVDKEGKVWIASGGGIAIYDGEKFSAFNYIDGTPFSNVRTIMEDRFGNMWFGGNDGLVHYDGRKLTNLARGFVGYLYEASDGSIYSSLTLEGGGSDIVLVRYKAPPLPVSVSAWKPEKIFSNGEMNFGIWEAKNGDIWFGTVGGVYRYDGNKVHTYKDR